MQYSIRESLIALLFSLSLAAVSRAAELDAFENADFENSAAHGRLDKYTEAARGFGFNGNGGARMSGFVRHSFEFPVKKTLKLKKGERYVVAEDVVTKGGRVQETIDLVKAAGAKVAGVVLLVDRSGGKVKFGRIPMFSLMQMTPVTWEPSECPLCKAGGKPCHPGS